MYIFFPFLFLLFQSLLFLKFLKGRVHATYPHPLEIRQCCTDIEVTARSALIDLIKICRHGNYLNVLFILQISKKKIMIPITMEFLFLLLRDMPPSPLPFLYPPPPLPFLYLHVYSYNITLIEFSTTIRILNNIYIQRSYSDFKTRDIAPLDLQASIKSGSKFKIWYSTGCQFESKSGRLKKITFLIKSFIVYFKIFTVRNLLIFNKQFWIVNNNLWM